MIYDYYNTIAGVTYHLFFAKSQGNAQIALMGGYRIIPADKNKEIKNIATLSIKQYS